MQRLNGIAAAEGIAWGRVRFLSSRLILADRTITAHQIAGELLRLEGALEHADRQLQEIGRGLSADRLASDLVDVQRLILRSDEIVQEVRRLVSGEGLAPETAVRRVVDGLVLRFEQMDQAYQRERAADVEAVGERLVRTIVNQPDDSAGPTPDGPEGVIAVGASLSAVEAFRLRMSGVAGLVTERGGKTSHLAIVLRDMGLPYVAGVSQILGAARSGALAVVDGGQGTVILDPEPEVLAEHQARRTRQVNRTLQLLRKPWAPAVTTDGVRVELAANVDALSDIARAVSSGAESVGLLRTELLYLARADLPSEEEQYQDGVAALEALSGRMATFRTLDLGGDKLPLAVPIASGSNPSLGVRAIRFSARRPDIFRTQLRALYRASAHGPLRILFPMITSVTEMKQVQEVAAQVRAELAGQGLAFHADVPLGAMIETPSAALTVDHLADHCDFFSIGTNDLIQYTLAADRDNGDVQYLHQPLHPAVLRLLDQAIGSANAAGKPIGMCGDMAGEPDMTAVLLGLGLREFSMIAGRIPAVRAVVTQLSLAEARSLASECLRLRSAEDVQELAARFGQQHGGELDSLDALS